MPDVKISDLSVAGALDGTEVVPLLQGGVTKKATLNQIGSAVPRPGSELGYAERLLTDTTTNTLFTYAAFAANVINGLTVVVMGRGRPVDVEFWCGQVYTSTVNKATFAALLMNGAIVNYGASVSASTVNGSVLAVRRRLVLPDGVQHTFDIGKATTGGTSTFIADAAGLVTPMFLAVTQR